MAELTDGGPALADLGAVLEVVAEDGSRSLVRVSCVAHGPAALAILLPHVRRVLSPDQIVDELLGAPPAPLTVMETTFRD